MTKIVIYSKDNCTYCTKAKSLVKRLGLDYEEKTMESFESVDKMLEDIGKQVKQIPQIKIDGELIGGYNQLVEYFEKQGKVNFKGELTNK